MRIVSVVIPNSQLIPLIQRPSKHMFQQRNAPCTQSNLQSLSQSIAVPGNDRLMNARQVAAKLGVSERWVRDHTTRRSPRIRGLKMGSLMRYRLADVETFLAELDTQPSSRPSRFRV